MVVPRPLIMASSPLPPTPTRFYIPAAMESNPMTLGLVLGTKFWIYVTATYYVSSILLRRGAGPVGRGKRRIGARWRNCVLEEYDMHIFH